MDLYPVPFGYEKEARLAVQGALTAVDSIVRIDTKRGNRRVGPASYVAVFSPNDSLLDVEREVRRVMVALVNAAQQEKEVA